MRPTTIPPASTPDLESYLRVHRALRASAAQLADATAVPCDARQAAALRRWYRGFAGEIRCHHHIEDELLFPALAARVATYADHAPRLDGDHAEVDQLLDALAASLGSGDLAQAASLASGLRRHLDEHLGYEDDEIAPLFARHFTGAEFDELNARAVRMTSPRQLLFTAPWLMSTLDATGQADVLAAAPKAMRLLWICTRGRYGRLAARALRASR